MHHLRTIFDLNDRATVEKLLVRAQLLKRRRTERRLAPSLSGRVIGMYFEQPSTRTRASFETGVALLGGAAVVLHGRDTELATQVEGGEPVRDAARALGAYVDVLVVRARRHENLEEFARHARVPVVNGGSALDHPCQLLTDLFTVFERREDPFAVRWAYVGEAGAIAHGTVALAGIAGLDVALALPDGQTIDEGVLKNARAKGGAIRITNDPKAAVEGANVVATAVWSSTATLADSQRTAREETLRAYQLNDALVAHAASDHVVLHPLPAHRGLEITDDVLEGQHSVAFQQAGNRLCVQQALLEWLLGVPLDA